MATAYILLNTKPNSETKIISDIGEIVKGSSHIGYEVQGVYGVYDIVVKIGCKDMEEVRRMLSKIRRVDQVISTITMLVNEAQEE